jgi:hypothetical protein
MRPIGYPETSVWNNPCTLHNIPQDGRSHLHLGGSLKSRVLFMFIRIYVQRVALKVQFLNLFFAQILRIFDTLAFVRLSVVRMKSRDE